MTELDGCRIAAVFAADADFELRARGAAAFDAPFHQLADAFLIERFDGIIFENLVRDIVRQKAAGNVTGKANETGLFKQAILAAHFSSQRRSMVIAMFPVLDQANENAPSGTKNSVLSK